jgi:O-acetyl-ADP-ribose deacetylase (regulator of RNase III)
MRLVAVHGDIVGQEVDAIVNAANERMRGGGGVDGAIHRAAGPGLLQELIERFPHGLPTGEAGWSSGHALPARYVIHVVGPVYDGTGANRHLLESCYVNALKVADQIGARTVAFPLVSAGVYGWPKDDAIRCAIESLSTATTEVEEARIVAFDAATYQLVSAALTAG